MSGDYHREVLSNGLRVLGVEKRALHSFVCSTYIHAGPRFEPPERTGLTHFLEHMLMQGSRDYPSFNAIMSSVEDLGGVAEGHTFPEYMRVTFGVHRKHWERLIETVADVILNPLFDEAAVEQEKSIVAQEISRHRDRKGRNISVHELAHQLLLRERLDESGTRGLPHLIQAFDRPLVAEHYRRFFVPQNMVLCLAGGFDFEQVTGALRARFEAIGPDRNVPPLLPPQLSRRRARVFFRPTEALPVVDVLLCYHAFPLGHERFDALRAVAQLLGGGLTSRLFGRVREELGLVYEIQSYLHCFSDIGALYVYLSASVENVVDALEAALQVVRSTAEGNFSRTELHRYKESTRCGMEIVCDHPQRLADWFGRQELFLGPERVLTPDQYVKRQEALTLDDVGGVLEHVFVRRGANLVLAGPFGEDQVRRVRQVFPAEEAQIIAAAGQRKAGVDGVKRGGEADE